MSVAFEPTLQAAQALLAAVRPGAYARTRNHLSGDVTRLSPYLTHGFLSLPEVLQALQAQHHLPMTHKLVFELGWREYFHHVWRLDGEKIFESHHPGPLPEPAYAQTLPADVAQARTGLPVVDQAVRELYATGYLHNHARMWLASYLVHLRKVHWRCGADWLYAHLLDGDLASNHLSWQWVAGTGSSKPYLFNAENVARYAPPHWQGPRTALDTSYEELDRMARDANYRALPNETAPGIPEPEMRNLNDLAELSPPDPRLIEGKDIWLVHPWNLRDVPSGLWPVAVCDLDFHQRWPWSCQRWEFVMQRMAGLAQVRWLAKGEALRQALKAAKSIHGLGNPHLGSLGEALGLPTLPKAFFDPAQRCHSFFSFWSKAQKHGPQIALAQAALSFT